MFNSWKYFDAAAEDFIHCVLTLAHLWCMCVHLRFWQVKTGTRWCTMASLHMVGLHRQEWSCAFTLSSFSSVETVSDSCLTKERLTKASVYNYSIGNNLKVIPGFVAVHFKMSLVLLFYHAIFCMTYIISLASVPIQISSWTSSWPSLWTTWLVRVQAILLRSHRKCLMPTWTRLHNNTGGGGAGVRQREREPI